MIILKDPVAHVPVELRQGGQQVYLGWLERLLTPA